jgi:hypothetical protein
MARQAELEAVMTLRVFRTSVLAVVLTAGLALAACSSTPAGSQSAAKVIPDIVAAADAATSVHIAGSGPDGSQTAVLNMNFSGTSLFGTVGVNGKILYILSVDGKTYIKIDPGFLQVANAPASACAKYCGKYVEFPAATASQITGSLSLHQILTQAFSNKNTTAAEQSGDVFSPATLNGRRVLQVKQGGYVFDVAAHGKPYPVYLTGPHGENLSFSDWDTVTPPAAPAPSQVISIPNLG